MHKDMPKRHSERLRKVQSTRDRLLSLVKGHRRGEDAGIENLADILSRYIAAGRDGESSVMRGSGQGSPGRDSKVLGS